MTASLPRIVLITRRTPLESLLERFGTRGQAEFYLRSRGQELAWAQGVHDKLYAALGSVQQAIPAHQRRVRIDRDDLDRFLFAPDDLVVIVGSQAHLDEYCPGVTIQRWDTDEPSLRGIDGIDRMRIIRDDITTRVQALAANLSTAITPPTGQPSRSNARIERS